MPASVPPTSAVLPSIPRLSLFESWKLRIQRFFRKYGHKLWWLHSCYALALGVSVVFFAQKGFNHARWLAVSLGAAWILVLFFFRLFGTGARQQYATAERSGRVRFVVMTYVLKNLYQGMLFFLLPFYWKSATLDSPNRYYVFVLGACAILSTLDVVFDRFLMRWRNVASVFYAVTLFSCLNLVIPAWLANTRTLYTLVAAAGITVLAFFTLHVPIAALRRKGYLALLVASLAVGMGGAYALRREIPPVPMHVSHAGVGADVMPDGRLAAELSTVHVSRVHELQAVTDVVVPGGRGDRLHHVWRLHGREVWRALDPSTHSSGPRGTVRLTSALHTKAGPAQLLGPWSVDVETDDGQLVGRASFTVFQ